MEYSRQEAWNQPQPPPQDNKRIAAGILAILLGPLGIHKFYLGYNTEGFLYLLISICTCGVLSSLFGIIEGIIYLTKTDADFYETYQVNKKGWF